MWTCPTELNFALRSMPLDSMLTVQRHVAYDVLSTWEMAGRYVSFEDDLGHGEGSFVSLEHFCETADSICIVTIDGDKITPTFSLV